MPKQPASGHNTVLPKTEIDREKLYDIALRAENLARAALMLCDDVTELQLAGCPPVLRLLEMVTEDLDHLSRELST